MASLKRTIINDCKRVERLGYYCRQISAVGIVIAVLHLSLCHVFAYESQFADNNKRIRLRWRSDVITVAFSNSLRQPAANIKSNSDVVGAVRNSLKTWEAAANVKFTTFWSDKTSISPLDTNGDGVSLITTAATTENTALFQTELMEMPGCTRTFYNKRGNITESDVVLNPYQQFSTDGSFGTFDLEAALTHEIGHLLGLDHSDVLAATMYSQQGKNGTYSLSATTPRTLAEDDRAGVRSLYNMRIEAENCCGTINGFLTNLDGKQLANWQVWIEEIDTGKLFAAVKTNGTGFWKIEGLPGGKYQTRSQIAGLNAEDLGTAVIEAGKKIVLNRKIATHRNSFGSFLLGFNGQLSALAIPLDAGRWQSVFIAGENLIDENSKLETRIIGSSLLQILSGTLTKQDFAAPFPVASFNLQPAFDFPPGEYNLEIQRSNGERFYLLGSFTVEPN